MTSDERTGWDRALRSARLAAYPPGEFVGQESFMAAGEILSLARRAGIGSGTSVLDLCCGVAGPGRFITATLGCRYTGVDTDPDAIAIAQRRAADLDCGFQVARIPPIPAGGFDVVLLLETMLAFSDKRTLLAAVHSALNGGGRFAFTVEEGPPLTAAERVSMPDADTVHPIRLPQLHASLRQAGLRVRWQHECSRAHHARVCSLYGAFVAAESVIATRLGRRATGDLLVAHRLWRDWLRTGRVRKFAVVAEKSPEKSPESAQLR